MPGYEESWVWVKGGTGPQGGVLLSPLGGEGRCLPKDLRSISDGKANCFPVGVYCTSLDLCWSGLTGAYMRLSEQYHA